MRSIALRVEHRQQQSLSPRLQQAVRLLQLSSLDFAQEVHDALGKNPFLEGDESDPEAPAADLPETDVEPGLAAPAAASADEPFLDTSAVMDTSPEGDADGDVDYSERDSWQADGLSSQRRGEEGDLSAMDMMAVETSLNEHLHGQINVLPLSMRDVVLAKSIVESLDDDGYLRTDLDELIELTELDPPASPDELQVALRLVQSLDPLGVAARSVGECLLLQLSSIEDEGEREIARHIVTDHLDCLAAKDVAGLARKLKRTPAEIEGVCDRIRRLDPRPGWHFGASQVQYVTPDVIIRKLRGAWRVQLNPSIVPKVRLNHVYAEMFQRHRQAQNGEMAAHLQEARWTVRNIEQRFATILSVSEAIVKRQKHFFEYGALAMKPLGLREIADEVGLHESTVSRVTNNKYMATPLGVFELKYFFSRAMTTASGGACSATAIRGVIKDMIEAERSSAPLSDAEIARQLAQQGLVVARRTVTKYRQLLKIEAVERRRRAA
ncbi:MAG: RNA polymerase factor sigma-54 [Methylibium sp.]|uniref:RNA polymerase factor sigma-54 n=1 Tax=Methylibium sp. TaxID=2067992 RepID=UPI00181495DF|nr:RNA polymerase factor sigma-54 [Methylibium sp.]MBA3596931.1 RNA polymerase factor sigma-54 [Methylibium sp.]